MVGKQRLMIKTEVKSYTSTVLLKKKYPDLLENHHTKSRYFRVLRILFKDI